MINVNEILHRLIAEFKTIDQVTAIAMSGSKCSNYQDDLSDIKINIYYTEPIAPEIRQQILTKFSDMIELDALYNEEVDHCLLRDFAIELEIVYLNIKEVEERLRSVMNEACVTPQSSTKIAYFIHYSNVLFDRHEQLEMLKQNYTNGYSDQLQQKIVNVQYPLLKQSNRSYYTKISRALEHKDRVNMSDLLNDYLKSYLDIVFAINRQFYPIDKRVLQIVEDSCPLHPTLMKEYMDLLFVHASRYDKQLLNVMDIMSSQLSEILEKEQLI